MNWLILFKECMNIIILLLGIVRYLNIKVSLMKGYQKIKVLLKDNNLKQCVTLQQHENLQQIYLSYTKKKDARRFLNGY